MTAVERKWFEAVAAVENCVLCQRFGVQVSHSNQMRGKSQKSNPWNTAALCPQCHHEIDNGHVLSREERRALHDKAIVRTHDVLISRGVLKLI